MRFAQDITHSWRRWPLVVLLTGSAAAILISVLAHAQTAAPSPETDPVAFAAWVYHAARTGNGRLVLAGVLLAAVAAWRKVTVLVGPRLEASAWYRENALPLVPIALAIAGMLAIDLQAGKPVGASLWRAVGVGLMAGGAYKALYRPARNLVAWTWRKVR